MCKGLNCFSSSQLHGFVIDMTILSRWESWFQSMMSWRRCQGWLNKGVVFDRLKHFDIIDTWNLKYHEIATVKWVFQLDDSQSLHENGCVSPNIPLKNDCLGYQVVIIFRLWMESVFRKVEMWIGEELDYGPNGGLVFAMEYLSENMNWLEAWTSKQPVTKVEGMT